MRTLPVLLLAVSSCAVPVEPELVSLGATQHLVRASMALKGTRPSVDELKAVEADATKLPGIVDRYLDSPEFGATMRDLHNEAFLVRTDATVFPAGYPAIGPLAGFELQQVNTSLIEEPLKLIETVVMENRPYSEIVTAEWALADGVVAAAYGLPHSGDASAWEKTAWPQGHPGAGVLSSPLVFTRHATTISNANRGRANAVAKALLCYDFAARDIEISAGINLADPQAVATAVRTDAACASCHHTLDPLAAYLSIYMPIYVPASIDGYPLRIFADEGTTPYWIKDGMTRSTPGFFGRPVEGLANLGQLIAQDPRFTLCATKRFLAYFTQRRIEDLPFETVARLDHAFIDSGLKAKALARAIVLSDDFKISHGTTEAAAEGAVGFYKARPEELARLVRDLTGFLWQTEIALEMSGPGRGKVGRVDLVTDSLFGFKVHAGGIDSYFVTLPTYTYNTTASLFLRQFAEEAAQYAIETDFAAPAGQRRLLTRIDERDTSEQAVRAQLSELHARIYGRLEAPNSEAVGETHALFAAALSASNDPRRAWKTTVAAMLQDLAVAFY